MITTLATRWQRQTSQVEVDVIPVTDPHQLQSNLRTVSRLAGLFGVAVGIGVLAGWACGIEALKTVLPGYPPMAPNAAVGLMLVGTALSFDRRAHSSAAWSLLARICALI